MLPGDRPRARIRLCAISDDVVEVAVALAHVESVPHHPARRHLEALIPDEVLQVSHTLPYEETADLDARRLASHQRPPEVPQRQTAVRDVLDEDDVTASEVDVEVLEDPHDPARAGGRPVRRHGHEVHLDGTVDGPGQVGHE